MGEMQIRKLAKLDINELLHAINGAFADYIVPFELDTAQLQFKIDSESIRLDWSVGVFEMNRLIAFIMHGVRTEDNEVIVYNAGTGVLPGYRGQGLVGKMYDHILPFLKDNQVKQLVLEVIEDNRSAIRAYEKIGFSVHRKLLCFSGTLRPGTFSGQVSVRQLNSYSWDIFRSFWDVLPSWQSAIPSMDVARPVVLAAFIKEELVGYMLFNPGNKRIYQIGVAEQHRRQGIATQLLVEVRRQMADEKVQVNNMDEAGDSLRLFLEKRGLTNHINQLEMVKHLF